MKHRKFHYIHFALLSLCTMLFVSACASAGNRALRNETETSVKAKITVGVTTKEQVRALFGSPGATEYTDGGLEIWKYDLEKLHSDAVEYIPIVGLFGSSKSGTRKTLVILFDDNDVVKKFNMSESPVTVKSGIFN